MIHGLAEYEGYHDDVQTTEADLERALFGPDPQVFAHVAVEDDEIRGMAIWFLDYSTWTGVHGIYLEDLYVRPAARQSGAGHALLLALAQLAVARGYSRVSWSVLTWNEPALEFYRAHGARPLDGWIGYRLSGDELLALGTSEPA